MALEKRLAQCPRKKSALCLLLLIVYGNFKAVADPNFMLPPMPEKFMEGGTPQPATSGQNALRDNMPLDPAKMAYVGRHTALEQIGPADAEGHAGDLSRGQLLNWVYGSSELKEAPQPITRPSFRGSESGDGAGSNLDPMPMPSVSTAVESGAFFSDSSGIKVDNS